MKKLGSHIRLYLLGAFCTGMLAACGGNGNPPENKPTPLPSPEERPAQNSSIEGTSQPRDTTFVLPKP